MSPKTFKPVIRHATKTKTVTLHHHHTKAYRKRHIGLLVLTSFAVIILVATVIQYRLQIAASVSGSTHYISGLFSNKKNYDVKIHSTFGFDIMYDQKSFYASAIDATSGNLILGTDLSENRAYSVVRVTPTLVNSRSTQSALTLTYHNEIDYPAGKIPPLQDLQNLALNDGLVIPSSFEKTYSVNTMIGDQSFLKSSWTLRPSSPNTVQIRSEIVTYVGVVNNKPVTIVVNYGLGGSTINSPYDSIITSLRFGTQEQAASHQTDQVIAKLMTQRTLLDSVLFNRYASAASTEVSNTSSERVAALYGPAVVKIYNVYCMDISVKGIPFLKNACDGVEGSGFFVSQDGYVATNGHVATADPKSIIIQAAITASSKGDSSYLQTLINIAGIKQSDIAGKEQTAQEAIIIDKLYSIPDSLVSKTNDVSNLLVELGDKSPDVNAILASTTARKIYASQATIKPATLVASNYRAIDGIGGFKASDVAIIKIEGNNYPVTKLGSISQVTQGADLLILGYPGNATENGLVDGTTNTVTLTTGKVSSIKNASGSDRKLIETDTTIGHGNSGGPTFANNGDVIGIATYTIDGSGTGNGIYNYVRDIKDLIELAASSSIVFDTNSKTQDQWQKGIDAFYTAHYSKALVNFNAVKTLYPLDSRVDEFIITSTQRIKNGEDVQDFPVLAASIAGFVFLLGAGVAIILIVRHNKRHKIYKEQLAQGNIQPIVQGSAPQQVQLVGHVMSAPTPILVPQPITNVPLASGLSNDDVNSVPSAPSDNQDK